MQYNVPTGFAETLFRYNHFKIHSHRLFERKLKLNKTLRNFEEGNYHVS